jgi:hypothetical protein
MPAPLAGCPTGTYGSPAAQNAGTPGECFACGANGVEGNRTGFTTSTTALTDCICAKNHYQVGLACRAIGMGLMVWEARHAARFLHLPLPGSSLLSARCHIPAAGIYYTHAPRLHGLPRQRRHRHRRCLAHQRLRLPPWVRSCPAPRPEHQATTGLNSVLGWQASFQGWDATENGATAPRC